MAGPLWKQAGIDAFLTKPVNVHELQHKLTRLYGDMLQSRVAAELLFTAPAKLEVRHEAHKLQCGTCLLGI